MQRFHINLSVANLQESVTFYTHLFDTAPTVEKNDYAKWMLENPRINFSLSTHGSNYGIDHIGIQVEQDEELEELRQRLTHAGAPVLDQPAANCCYAQSTKAWIHDPDGVAWETFITRGESTVYGDGTDERAAPVAQRANFSGNRSVPNEHKERAGCCQPNA